MIYSNESHFVNRKIIKDVYTDIGAPITVRSADGAIYLKFNTSIPSIKITKPLVLGNSADLPVNASSPSASFGLINSQYSQTIACNMYYDSASSTWKSWQATGRASLITIDGVTGALIFKTSSTITAASSDLTSTLKTVFNVTADGDIFNTGSIMSSISANEAHVGLTFLSQGSLYLYTNSTGRGIYDTKDGNAVISKAWADTAWSFNGNITGNAATATKLSGAKTITFATGDVTGSFSFDGSGDVTNIKLSLPDAISAAKLTGTATGITGITMDSGQILLHQAAGALGSANPGESPFQIKQATANTDAFMQFHIGNDYAVNFGLDGTTNDLFVGGWSLGTNKYKICHAGNAGGFTVGVASKLDAIKTLSGIVKVTNGDPTIATAGIDYATVAQVAGFTGVSSYSSNTTITPAMAGKLIYLTAACTLTFSGTFTAGQVFTFASWTTGVITFVGSGIGLATPTGLYMRAQYSMVTVSFLNATNAIVTGAST